MLFYVLILILSTALWQYARQYSMIHRKWQIRWTICKHVGEAFGIVLWMSVQLPSSVKSLCVHKAVSKQRWSPTKAWVDYMQCLVWVWNALEKSVGLRFACISREWHRNTAQYCCSLDGARWNLNTIDKVHSMQALFCLLVRELVGIGAELGC